MTTVSKLNVNEIPLLIPIIVQTGVKNYGFARYCPNPGDVDAMITLKEYREFLEKMWTVYMKYKECGTRFALKDHLWKLFLYEKGLYDIFFGEEMEQYRKSTQAGTSDISPELHRLSLRSMSTACIADMQPFR